MFKDGNVMQKEGVKYFKVTYFPERTEKVFIQDKEYMFFLIMVKDVMRRL